MFRATFYILKLKTLHTSTHLSTILQFITMREKRKIRKKEEGEWQRDIQERARAGPGPRSSRCRNHPTKF